MNAKRLGGGELRCDCPGRSALSLFLVGALSLNIVSTAVPALIASYNDAQARIPHALGSISQTSGLPATETLPSGGKVSKLPDSTNAQLASDLAAARKGKQDLRHVKTLDTDRSSHTTVYQNADGSKSFVYSADAANFRDDAGNWQSVGPSLVEDKTNGKWHTKANSWQVMFGDIKDDGIQITQNGQIFAFTPVGGQSVKPIVSGNAPDQTVTYRNVWQGVDLQYKVTGSELKEDIVVKSRAAATDFAFDTTGANLSANPDQAGSFNLDGAFAGFTIVAPSVTTATVSSPNTKDVSQSAANGVVTVSLDSNWLASQSFAAFPIAIDPTVGPLSIGNNYDNVDAITTTGPVCTGSGCPGQAVGMDSGGDPWAFYYQTPFTVPTLGYLTAASLHLELLSGDTTSRAITVDQSTCQNSINGCGNAVGESTGTIASVGNVDVTSVYRAAINGGAGAMSPWLMVTGDETDPGAYKLFNATKTTVTLTFDTLPAGLAMGTGSPADGGVSVSTQPTLYENTTGITDPDGPGPNQYRFIVGTGKNIPPSNPNNLLPSVTGVVADSGRQLINQWTVPDKVLQDGVTYYWQPLLWDFATGVPDVYGPVYSFKVDLRNGKDNTQATDEVGPVSADLATGNLATSTQSHSIAALGGSMGIGLSYNSPQRSKNGLIGQYWNDPSGTHTIPSTAAALTRTDPNISFNWGANSPYTGLISTDNFLARWTGYFVAPQAGTYQFGSTGHDGVRIYINNTLNLDSWSADPVNVYGTGIALTAGQVVPIKYEYDAWTGNADTQLLVKTTDGSINQVVPSTWLQTGASSIVTTHGLVGRYYTDDGTHTFDATNLNNIFLTRTDSSLSMDWGAGSPVPNGPTDNFIVRWTGYFTAPTSDTYTFGTGSDDGSRIYLDGNLTTPVMDAWSDHGNSPLHYAASGVTMAAGQTKMITVDYYEHSGSANITLYMHQASLGGGTLDIPVPSSALTTQAQVLPDGWNLGIDADGNLSYDRAYITSGSVTLIDSTGQTHAYTYTNNAFTPPVGEDGHMVRNSDSTITFQDADGRTYVFNPDGTIKSVTNSVDDLHPAALQYTYGSTNGSPSHLIQITDGVNSARWTKVLYTGDANCPTVPSGFLAYSDARIAGMICAVYTSDGTQTLPVSVANNNVTRLLYTADTGGHPRLGRVEHPGGDMSDYGYLTEDPANPTSCPGCLSTLRDSLANDAVAAGVRSQDGTEQTVITYDSLGKVSSITMPAATAGATREGHSYGYFPVNTPYTLVHVANATEPNGYTRKVLYDSTYRTTDDYDIAALDTTTQWDAAKDLVLSTTDPSGLMSTTLYDFDNRATDEYGPAPSTWFDTNPADAGYHKPLTTPTDYTPQVPHTQTGYDQSISGLAAAYYNVDTFANGTPTPSQALYGAPKLHGTGIGAANGDITHTWGSAQPFTPDAGKGWGLRLTGNIHLTATGTYNFRINSNDGVRLFIDDQLVIDGWTNSSTPRNQTGTYSNAHSPADWWPRIRLEYYNQPATTTATLNLFMTPPGGSETGSLGSLLTPTYGLATSQTTYDSSMSVGNSATTTNYGSNPELGLAQSSNLDSTGLGYTSSSTYEAQGATGSFLRQTAKYLPGANTANSSTATQYSYWGATDTADNPCTTGTVETYKQAGMVHTKIEPDPDGAGSQTSRTTDTIYDDAGRIVATRIGASNWTCTTYDSRGRVTQTKLSDGSSVYNNWAIGGNPLISGSGTTISGNTIVTTVDLLGRTTIYTPYINGATTTTTTTYDNLGRLASRTSPIGTETFVYDNYNRLTGQKLDGTVYATPSYDAYGRLSQVTYPTAGQLKLVIGRDSLGRVTSNTYTLGNGTTGPADTVTRSQSGQVISGTELGQSKSYGYDKAGRLTNASVFGHTYAYNFGTPTSCTGTYNPNAGKDSNRTSQTVDGVTTSYCYDYADRLISSSDPTLTATQYDTHGNMAQLGDFYNPHMYQFFYDAADRTIDVRENSGGTVDYQYNRDVQGRINFRTVSGSSVTTNTSYFGYTGAGDSPDYLMNTSNVILEKYLQLAGGVLLTKRSSTATFSLPNVHGDIFATTDQTGNALATFQYDPFGARIGTTSPSNITGGETLGWEGQNEKLSEIQGYTQTIQMGARTYIPVLGRFTGVDPQEGGNENPYVYPPDPVNDQDLDGNAGWSLKSVIKGVTAVASIGSMIPGPIGMIASGVAVAGYAAQGNYRQAAVYGAGIALAAVGAGAGIAAIKAVARAGVVAKISQKIANGNNVLRIGRTTPGAAFRMSIGPAPKSYRSISPVKKILSPIHVHIELKKVGIDFNWFKKAFYKKWR
jgi:RHS repeat-associated protein